MIYPVPALVIEGMEDTGKTTLFQVLQDRLEAEGYKVQRFTPERLKDPDDLVGWYNSHFKMGLEILRCQNRGETIPLVDRSYISFLIYQLGFGKEPRNLPAWISALSFEPDEAFFLYREKGLYAKEYESMAQSGAPFFLLKENEYLHEDAIQEILTKYKNRLKG